MEKDSDSDSVEEISAETFAAKTPAIKIALVDESKKQQNQVWTMNDLVKHPKKYQMTRNYAPGLYNFAWAQAVQNKPLDGYLTVTKTGTGTDNNLKQLNEGGDGLNNDKIVVDISDDDSDSEKEEGELEEGEIDLDIEAVSAGKEEDGKVEKWIEVIRVGLEGITLNDANKSFNGVCTRLEDMLDSLSTLLSENAVSNKDDLVQLAFSAIQLVNSVFCSMNQSQKELSRHIISRMLSNVKSHVFVMFSPEPLKELENMFLLCNSTDACSSTKADDKQKDSPDHVNQDVASVNEESILDKNFEQSESLKTQTSSTKNRVLLPLLDLHKDHDVDSLPSPTRETTNVLPLSKTLVGDAEIRPEWPAPTQSWAPHRCTTDAVKAVSTYQQKFIKSSFMLNDLPSPTPSEESNDASNDCGEEVSSIPNVQNLNFLASEERPNVARFQNKIRDPRLKLANTVSALEVNQVKVPLASSKQPAIEPLDGLQGSRKQKTFDESVLVDGPAPKRPKFESSGSAKGLDNVPTTSALPGTGVSATSASLQSVLKDISVNPTKWVKKFSIIQQGSVDSASHVTQTSQNSVSGASQSLVVKEKSTDGMQKQRPSSTDDPVKLRMKPRDPRRALHNKSLRKQETTTNLSTVKGKKGILKQTVPRPPDITRQLTKHLKNTADVVSTTASVSVQAPTSQVHPNSLQNGPRPGEVSSGPGPSQSHNAWGDVEQLFGRFDDQERAAIQRERSRRMEEQKKMFSDRKLCLVLDLDHTLLNSAKFSEIEPVHDEILRRKEEQDRDKPRRHLFRFPHMSMWTKLRPGVWNFLKKASKLYELHLYTMGNKVYATEMAKLLDPKGILFNGRVISRGDIGDNVDGDPKVKDLDGVLGMESAVVIIDDSIRVWPHNKLNLIVVERYIYFPCSRRQFGLSGPSLLEIDHDERPEDGSLASSLAVIEKIHKLFFMEKSLDEADARNILASEQRKILSGCRIVFSRVIPMGEASPHLHPLWQTAEQFGAVCTNQIDDQVTHVVANSLGTDKVNWALATGRPVVYPGWVEASALLYRRANEHDFVVKP